MTSSRVTAIVLLVLPLAACVGQPVPCSSMIPSLVIAHRGASGYRPEHTLAAYKLAIDQGADLIEPDLVSTRDGILVARHENEIGGTTDVATRPEFAARRTTRTIDGEILTGWFTEDFTLAELKTLRARERIPQVRPGNSRFDGESGIPTFDEVLELVAAINSQRREAARAAGRVAPPPIGIYPETKHPSYFQSIGLPLEEPLVAALSRHGYDSAEAPVFIQSFETANLRKLKTLTRVPLMQLIADSGAPYDFIATGDPRTYADLVTPAGLKGIAAYAAGIGAAKELVITRLASGALGHPTMLVRDAHAAGLRVHAWTFRAENPFLPANLRSSGDRTAHGDLATEIQAHLAAGVDGIFADQPDLAVAARRAYARPDPSGCKKH